MGIRAGHTFVFKNRPYRNIGLWVGTMFMSLESATAGQIRLGDAIPNLEERADEIVNEYTQWYESLPPAKQKIVDASPIPRIMDRIDDADGDVLSVARRQVARRPGAQRRARRPLLALRRHRVDRHLHARLPHPGLIGAS